MHVHFFAVRVPIIVILVCREDLTVTFLEFILDQQVEHLLYQCMELQKIQKFFKMVLEMKYGYLIHRQVHAQLSLVLQKRAS